MASKEARPRSGRVTAVRSQPVDSAPPAGQGEYSREWCGRLWVGESREDVDEAISEFEIAREAAARRDRRWPADGTAAMTALALLFPSLAEAGDIGIAPWEPEHLIAWLNGPAPGSGGKWAGRFCLGVWNSGTDWGELGLAAPGRFDVFEAMACWDRAHVQAMLTWLEAPFWP